MSVDESLLKEYAASSALPPKVPEPQKPITPISEVQGSVNLLVQRLKSLRPSAGEPPVRLMGSNEAVTRKINLCAGIA